MELITLKDISIGLGLIVGIWTGFAYLNKNLKGWLISQFNEYIQPLKGQIEEVDAKVSRVDLESCKNYLARCLADFENNKELSETEQERFWEQYEHYSQSGGNSYIKHKVEKLIKEGKL